MKITRHSAGFFVYTHRMTNADNSGTTTKRRKVTPTPRQRRAARLIVDAAQGTFQAKSTADIVKAAGYSDTAALVPHKVLNTSGVDIALAELGFTPEAAKSVVSQILNSSEAENKDKLKAADMVFKVHGTYAAEKHVNVNIDTEATPERVQELAALMRGRA